MRKIRSIKGQVVIPPAMGEDNFLALYFGAILFVIPSQYEGFGLSLLEAIAWHLPAVNSEAAAQVKVYDEIAFSVASDRVDLLAHATTHATVDVQVRQAI